MLLICDNCITALSMVSVPSLICRSSDNVALSIASLGAADEDENEIALLLPVRILQRGCILVRTTQLASPTGETNFIVNHFNIDSRVPQTAESPSERSIFVSFVYLYEVSVVPVLCTFRVKSVYRDSRE